MSNSKTVAWSKLTQITGRCHQGIEYKYATTISINNRIDNLQLLNPRQNISKSHLTRHKTSKFTGVSWSKEMGKWYSCIKTNGKNKNLGYYDSELEASLVYQLILKKIED